MQRDPVLLTLAVAEAPHPVHQHAVKEFARGIFRGAEFDVAATEAVFDNAGIERRTFALPLESYPGLSSFETRNRQYVEIAGKMLRQAADRAVPQEVREKVTHVVLVSSTGVATPSLDCATMQSLGLGADAQRVPIFGLGCAGGVAGLRLARDLARSDPGALVLVLCVELTSLTLLVNDASRRNYVACALFGDGAAAALVGATGNGIVPLAVLGEGLSRLFPGTHDLMGWDVLEEGWRVVFSPRIPAVVKNHLEELVRDVTEPRGVRHFLVHPGGRKILDAYSSTLGLSDAEMAPASFVLARHGNMSAATVFFVLDHVLRSPDFEPGSGLMVAFGPGFSAQLLALELQRPL